MNKTELRDTLYGLQDRRYREMQVKIIPSMAPETIIGVRTPALRTLAKELYRSGEYEEFLEDLPHEFFEENQLHALFPV